jgi:hypothetical protein
MNTQSQSSESCNPVHPIHIPTLSGSIFSNQMLSRYNQSLEVLKKCKLSPSFDELGQYDALP